MPVQGEDRPSLPSGQGGGLVRKQSRLGKLRVHQKTTVRKRKKEEKNLPDRSSPTSY